MNDTNLTKWALAAEILGGIAVVMTLMFLVLETRENTNAIQAQTYQSLTSELNEGRRAMATSGMTTIALKYINSGLESLSEHERYRFMFLIEAKWGIYESAYYARERGILGQNEWHRFENSICRNLEFDNTFWYPEKLELSILSNFPGLSIASNITPNFKEYVESLCS